MSGGRLVVLIVGGWPTRELDETYYMFTWLYPYPGVFEECLECVAMVYIGIEIISAISQPVRHDVIGRSAPPYRGAFLHHSMFTPRVSESGKKRIERTRWNLRRAITVFRVVSTPEKRPSLAM